MTKRFALDPREREKTCTHEHTRYQGAIPCTGPIVCLMCGEHIASDATSKAGRLDDDLVCYDDECNEHHNETGHHYGCGCTECMREYWLLKH